MKRAIAFAPLARLEFKEAARWYDEQRVGLGDEFRVEVNAVLQMVLKSPERFRRVSLSVHKVALNRFRKYSIYYSIELNVINAIVVFHASRDPAKLRRRLK
jgi:toxin ParE1/3/4